MMTMKKDKPSPEPETPDVQPWAETRPIHHMDILLREKGARIASRPKGAEPRWRYQGGVHLQADLIRALRLDEIVPLPQNCESENR